jgi:hypothetical protein
VINLIYSIHSSAAPFRYLDLSFSSKTDDSHLPCWLSWRWCRWLLFDLVFSTLFLLVLSSAECICIGKWKHTAIIHIIIRDLLLNNISNINICVWNSIFCGSRFLANRIRLLEEGEILLYNWIECYIIAYILLECGGWQQYENKQLLFVW